MVSVVVAVGYLCLLFAVAFVIDRRSHRAGADAALGSWMYALSIAVYCTSWTYYGSVGRSAADGIGFLPIYIGPMLVFVCCQPLLRKIVRVAKAQHITTIADFISARHGKDQALAGMVTVIAVIGIMPYIALQMKAVASSFQTINSHPSLAAATLQAHPPLYADTSLYVAIVMALFVILFGTRQVDATEQHRGMVAAVALESIVKLAAFLAVGAYVTYAMFGGWGELFAQAESRPTLARLLDFKAQLGSGNFWALTALAMTAIICLPRQFQVTVVENTDERHLRRSRWVFPLYLVAINIFVLPLALAGRLTFPAGSVSADSYVLALPIAADQPALAVLVFIGGLAAATGMIIVETIALSTMICNDLVMPVALRRAALHGAGDMSGRVKAIRRGAIVLVLLLSYAYGRGIGESYALVTIGLVSFAAAAQFAPAMVIGLYWTRGNRRGARAALATGFGVWCYTLLLPALARSGWLDTGFLDHGLFGLVALKPQALLGLSGLDPVAHSLLWSMPANIGAYVIASLLSQPDGIDRAQALAFVRSETLRGVEFGRRWSGEVTAGELLRLVGRFVDEPRVRRAYEAHAAQRNVSCDPTQRADVETVNFAERMLAGAVGSAVARVVVASAIREQVSLAGAMDLLADASHAMQSSWEQQREAIDNISQGINMFDADMRLVVWNRRLIELLDMPPGIFTVGAPFADFIRYNAQRGDYGPGDIEELVAERVALARQAQAHVFERELPSGRIIEVRGKPLPGGGFISTTTDITERKQAEQALRHANEELERRVAERTSELQASRERFRDFAESASDRFWQTDDGLRMNYLSDAFCEGLALRESEILGLEFSVLLQRGEVIENEGETRVAMLARRPFRGLEIVLPGRDGRTLQLRLGGKPCADAEGRFAGFRGTATDVTQLARAQAELIRSEKLAALGGLVAGVAHEINTPVGMCLTAATYVEEQRRAFERLYQAGEVKRSDVTHLLDAGAEANSAIVANLQRTAELVRSFKLVAVDQSSDQPRSFNLGSYLADVVRSLQPHLRRTPHHIEIRCPPDIELNGLPGAYSQVLTNLVMNSLTHAFDPQRPGLIEIDVDRSATCITLAYRDDGRGMPPEHVQRMFEPFFTTRRGQGGSGLGLHVVYNVVTQTLKGRIEASSAPGEGVIYRIDIPCETQP